MSLPPDAATFTTMPPRAVEVTDGLAAVYEYTGAFENVDGADEMETDDVAMPLRPATGYAVAFAGPY